MLGSVFKKTLYDQRKMFAWWLLAIVGVSLVYVASYKQFAEAGMLETNVPEYLSALMGRLDYTSAAGYLNSTFFTMIGAWMMVIFSLTVGARAIAGDEESGMLDVLLAHPVSRTRFVLERSGALAAAAALFGLAAWVSVSLSSLFAEMGIPLVNIGAACFGLALLGMVFGSLALAVGAFTGRTSLAIGVTTGVALAAFLANNLAPMLEYLDVAQKFSPFYYYLGNDPLREGFDAGGSAVLVAAGLVLAALAVWGLNRRDVSI
ncbi:MAG: ABC transporter permease [Coriobacteriia bacterium]|nr:ABC transporter permease [Coriobacteriia bacterium]